MLKYKLLSFIVLLTTTNVSINSSTSYKFRLYLKDKEGSGYNVNKPQEFLSGKAIERRFKQNISIDESDLPISSLYLSQIQALGCTVVAKSKWHNSVTVHCNDSSFAEKVSKLDFVEDAKLVWTSRGKTRSKKIAKTKSTSDFSDYYGSGYDHIRIHNGDSLHRAGFRAQGMEIALLDGGFFSVDGNPLLENVFIKGKKNFIYEEDGSFEGDHGLGVFSCMAANLPGIYVGTAPAAHYWLFQTENPASEFPVEEDYWVAAAEYADSVGVDLINSSLGYTVFDDSKMSHVYDEYDGQQIFITKGASMAAQKGIFVVTSAGNEGNKAWRYISAPGDSEEAFTVGAIKIDSTIASFSSVGPTADGRIKPDVVAQGYDVSIIKPDGNIGKSGGTSYSSPIMCGLIACLWQAFPHLTNKQLADVVKESSDRYQVPDTVFGYGIPDMIKAMDIAQRQTSIIPNILYNNYFSIVKDTTTGDISIVKNIEDRLLYRVQIISLTGKVILSDSFASKTKTYKLKKEKGSLYIINVRSKDFHKSEKVLF